MDDIKLKTFPSSPYEFVASLWLQQQDLTGKSPAEIWDMYSSALSEVKEKVKADAPPRTPSTRTRRSSGGIF